MEEDEGEWMRVGGSDSCCFGAWRVHQACAHRELITCFCRWPRSHIAWWPISNWDQSTTPVLPEAPDMEVTAHPGSMGPMPETHTSWSSLPPSEKSHLPASDCLPLQTQTLLWSEAMSMWCWADAPPDHRNAELCGPGVTQPQTRGRACSDTYTAGWTLVSWVWVLRTSLSLPLHQPPQVTQETYRETWKYYWRSQTCLFYPQGLEMELSGLCTC